MTAFAQSGRARIAYDATGPEDGPAVLLVHAGVNDRRGWHHVVERLSPRHRCVTFDMRGHGETEYEPEEGWSPDRDALAVMDAAGLDRPLVVAASMGGQAAVDLALAHPARVAALVLVGAAIRGAPYQGLMDPDGRMEALFAQMEAAEAAGDLDRLNRLETRYWLDGPAGEEGRASDAARELFLDMNARILRAEDPGPPAELPDAWPRLGELAIPVLVLVGTLDEPDLVAVAEQAAELIPGARLRVLDGVGHVPHLEGDLATLDEIAAFAAGAL